MTTVKQLLASLLWDVANLLNWVADEFCCPPAQPEPKNYRPEDQYPVGTMIYAPDGQVWKLQTTGRWISVEQDGEPLEPDCRCLNDVYCPTCEDDE